MPNSPQFSFVAQTDLFWTRPKEAFTTPFALSDLLSRRSKNFLHPVLILGVLLLVEALLKSRSHSRLNASQNRLLEWILIFLRRLPSLLKLSHTHLLRFVIMSKCTYHEQNAGLHPIAIVTDLRNKHASGHKTYGINIKKVC